MYRIKLGSGDESVFNSIEELSFGIGTGIIGQDAQIYHDRAEKWLPVTVHPAYKKAAAYAPPPDPTLDSAPQTDEESTPPSEIEPAQASAQDDGQDLLTLMNLEELAEFDPRKVQESAATQDSADSSESANGQAPAASAAVQPPESADRSDMVDLPTVDEEPASSEDHEEDGPVAELEFIAMPEEDDEEEAEAAVVEDVAVEADEPAVDGFEPTALEDEDDDSELDGEQSPPADLAEILDVSADHDDLSTQALDAVMEEPSLEVMEVASPAQEDEAIDETDDPADDDGLHEDPVQAAVVPESEAEIEEAAEAEDVLHEIRPADELPAVGEEEPLAEGVMEATRSFGDAWDDPDATWEAPDPDPDDLDDEDDVESPVATIPDVEEDPIAAFDPEADDLLADGSPVLASRLPSVNRKPLVVLAIAACLIIVAGVVWMLKGAAFAQDGDDPVPTTGAAAAIPTVPAPAAAAVPDSAASDSAAQAMQLEYEEGYARAQVRFDDALRRAGFVNLFAATRFSSASEMAAARAAIRNARRALGDYAVREGTIESSYADVDPSLRETRANRELAEDLLAVADSLYGILLGNLESFAVRAGAMTFTDDGVEVEYARLQDEVDRLMVLASGVEDAVQSASISRVTAGIGTTRPLPLSALAPAPALPPDLAPGN